jgi:hypothetical protein
MRRALAASVVALLAAAPALVAEAAQPAASHYVPTMADYLGVYDALQNYRWGVEKHDQKALERAFWEDGTNIAVPSPGQEINMPLKEGGGPPQPPSGGPPGPGAGPPPGFNAGQPGPNGGPPPGFAPPPGANAGPPGAGGGAGGGGGGGGGVWHLPLDSYIHFDSATRATHYEYFLSIYPQPERKRAEGATGSMQDSRTSIVGWPGHYEDILEKRHGEWRILHRKSMINQK